MKRLSLCFSATAILFALPVSLLAATINIPADHATIQAGIDNATDGDTVLVAPGTYVENLDYLGKAVAVVSSEGADSTTLIPALPNSYLVRVDGFLNGDAALSGFTITGGGYSPTIRLVNASITISYNIFAYNIPIEDLSRAVIQGNTSAALIKRNIFYGNGGTSCVHIGGSEAEIINNTFDSNNRAIFITTKISVYNNIVTNSYGNGVRVRQTNSEFTDYNCIYNNNPDYAGGILSAAHDINLPPLYENSDSFNFNLTLSSPCVKTGNPDPQYNNPDGTRSDIGALPFDPAGLQLPLIVGVNFSPEHIVHIVSNSPIINWYYYDDVNPQEAYQIQIGIDSDWSVAELWNTGVVSGDDSSAVYSGSPMLDGETYYGRIQATNSMAAGAWTEFSFRLNTAPPMPVLLEPINADTGSTLKPVSVDAEADLVMFDYEIYTDAELTNLVLTQERVGGSLFHPVLDHQQAFWWRARADDNFEKSVFSQAESFVYFDMQFCCRGMRGNMDFDPDDRANVADIAYMVAWLFGIPSGPAPVCQEEANANGDPTGATAVADISYMIAWLFGIPSGPAPGPCPW